MGAFSNKKSRKTNLEGSVDAKKHRSKGDRLGWVSVNEVESVKLREALSKGRRVVVDQKSKSSALLVP